MTPTALDLARRLVAAPWWDPTNTQSRGLDRVDGHLPDLTTWPTVGVLLGMLAEPDDVDVQVYSLPPLHPREAGWRVVVYTFDEDEDAQSMTEHIAPTLGEAVALALLEVRS